jgi:adenylate cyclase
MKRKSFVVTILISFWISYAVISISDFSIHTSQQMTPYIQKAKDNIDFHMKTVQRYLFSGDIEGVKEYLERAHKKKELNFGVVNFSGKTVFSFNQGQIFQGPDPDTDRDYKLVNEFVESEQVIYKTQIVDDVKVTLGANKLDIGFLTSELMSVRYRMLVNFGLITLLVGVLIYLIMRDVISLTKAIEENDWAAVGKIDARSREGGTLIRVATGLKGLFDRSQSWNKKLEHAVAPALLKQIENSNNLFEKDNAFNTDTDDVFENILVTIDWNDHTELFFKSGMPIIDEIRNKTFGICNIIIERYNGLRLDSQGDSLTFLIEKVDEKKSNAKIMALSCVRDIFAAIEKIETDFVKTHYSDKNITLKFKAAMVDGHFEFKTSAIDYKFSSAAWYEAARAMSNVTRKDKNSLVILSRDQEDLDLFAHFSEQREVTFKGFPQPVSVKSVESFISFEEVCLDSSIKQINLQRLTYFRADQDIAKILRLIDQISNSEFDSDSNFNLKPQKLPIEFFQILRNIKIRAYTENELIPETYNLVLQSLMQKSINHKNTIPKNTILRGDEEILASFTLLACNLIVRDERSYKIIQTLFRLENHTNRRVIANLMDALRVLIDDNSWALKYLDSEDNRILGNALIIFGLESVDQKIISRIENMQKSTHPHFVATSIFVQCYLYMYHFQFNQVYCKTNKFLRETPGRIKELLQHKNKTVQNRASESLSQIEVIEKSFYKQVV